MKQYITIIIPDGKEPSPGQMISSGTLQSVGQTSGRTVTRRKERLFHWLPVRL